MTAACPGLHAIMSYMAMAGSFLGPELLFAACLAIARLTSQQLRTWCNLGCLAGAAYMLEMQCMLAQLLGVHSQHMCVELLMCACRFSNLKARFSNLKASC